MSTDVLPKLMKIPKKLKEKLSAQEMRVNFWLNRDGKLPDTVPGEGPKKKQLYNNLWLEKDEKEGGASDGEAARSRSRSGERGAGEDGEGKEGRSPRETVVAGKAYAELLKAGGKHCLGGTDCAAGLESLGRVLSLHSK